MFSVSTRNNAYERLEGGIGSGRSSRKLPWKKIAIGCGTLMGLVWFFGPRGDALSRGFPTKGILDQDTVYTPPGKVPLDSTEHVSPLPAPSPSIPFYPSDDDPSSSSSSSPSIIIPTSPETDPDLLKTVHCTTSYASYLPLVQYALMIDAGSTGSRIHIYKFHNCGPTPAYEYEVFRMTQPGLSGSPTAANDGTQRWTPEEAAASLDVLLDEAVAIVPPSLHGCTPLAVKATAGLRALGEREGQAILDAVEVRLRTRYPFVLPERDGVVIMDGRDEGVYAWITVNYLMGAVRVGARSLTSEGTGTYAVLDLGGGSTQIVFEPEREPGGAPLKEGEHKYALAFGGEERVLYQHSYLGYGLKSARESVHRVVEFMDGLRRSSREVVLEEDELPRVPNPCLAQKTTKEVDVPLGEGKGKTRVLMSGEDVGSFEACNRVLELVMAKDAVCEVKPCSFNGVYQPSLLDTFPTGKVLLLSYFYDRAMPLIPQPPEGVQPHMTVSTFATLASQVCAGPSSWVEHWGAYPEVIEELEDRPEWCLDLTFMHALLRLGYEFEGARDVGLGKRIAGTELGWCLGATIAMVGGGEIKCKD